MRCSSLGAIGMVKLGFQRKTLGRISVSLDFAILTLSSQAYPVVLTTLFFSLKTDMSTLLVVIFMGSLEAKIASLIIPSHLL
jgi:hypothetical protein